MAQRTEPPDKISHRDHQEPRPRSKTLKKPEPATSARGALLKVLTAARVDSRRQLADAIKHGRVMVNGAVVDNFSYPVDVNSDAILLDGKRVQFTKQRRVILMLNKPAGIVTTTSDEMGRATVMDILPAEYQNIGLYPVGRLDKESTGLLLVTNDGDITYRLTHPRFEQEKEYLIAINGKLKESEMEQLRGGVALDDGVTSPTSIKETRGYPPFNYRMIIHEGKKRQIRRMFEHFGYRVIALKRVRFGRLTLGTLPERQVRDLTPVEIAKLLD